MSDSSAQSSTPSSLQPTTPSSAAPSSPSTEAATLSSVAESAASAVASSPTPKSPTPSSVASGTPPRDESPPAAPPPRDGYPPAAPPRDGSPPPAPPRDGSSTSSASSSSEEAEDPSSNEAVAEAFEPGNFGTLEEHVKAHNFPMHVRTCGPCKFWQNRWKWSMQASFANTVTGQRETWLMCVGGFAACKVCRQYGGSARRDDLALGRGSFARFQNILRHGNATSAQQKKLATWFGPQPGINWDHEMAVQQWCREKSSA